MKAHTTFDPMRLMTFRNFFPMSFLLVSLLVFAAGIPSPVRAQTVNAKVMVDFNGYVPGAIYSGPSSTQPLGIDVGFAATADHWEGATNPVQVVTGSLALDYPTNYAIVQQTGSSSMVARITFSTPATALRQQYRTLAEPMVGTIWGSFLMRQSKTESEGASVYQMTGLTFNIGTNTVDIGTAAAGNKRRIFAIGSTLAISSNSGTITGAPTVEVPDQYAANETALTLFRYNTSTKQLDVWVDPSLPSHPVQLSTVSAAWSGTCDLLGTGSLSILGIGGNYYVDGGKSGDLDAIRLDNTGDAYFAVTGISKFAPVDLVTAPVVADFNNCNLGSLNGQGGGAGFAASGSWAAGTSVLVVIAEDLVPPASTRYAVTQPSVNPRSVQAGNVSALYIRQQHRALETPLSGSVWGSFLVRNANAVQKTGITFNLVAGSGSLDAAANQVRWLYANGTSLELRSNTANASGPVENIPNVFALNETALVLFNYDTAAKRIRVWVNPVLPDSAAGLSSLAPVYDSGAVEFDLFGGSNQLSTIGVMGNTPPETAYKSGVLDALRLASGANGYYAVTGLPVPPEILASPETQSILEGGTASFTVSATGNWGLSYQWLRAGTALPLATGGTLTITNAQASDAGEYRVVVINSGGIGMAVSAPANLIVGQAVPLEILSGPTIQPSSTVASGTTVSMVVTGTGTEPLSYQWLKSGSNIAGATSGTYTIGSVAVAHAGDYSARLSDGTGTSVYSGTVTLTVLGPPVITAQPQSRTAYKGESATFTVSATCASPMTYQWYHGGTAIAGATDASYIIPSVDSADAGAYRARVYNADYTTYYVDSSNATLTVKFVDVGSAPVNADFNDCNAPANGRLDNAANDNTGVGFSNIKWEGNSGVPCIAYEDLVAPAFTRYAIAQAGNPRSVWGNNSGANIIRQGYRTLTSPLSGTVWGSFLVNNGNATHMTGVTFNLVGGANGVISETANNTRWLYARGTSLVVRSNTGAEAANVPGVFTFGQTALVLFSYDTAAKKLNVWVNPVLTDTTEGMDSVAPTYTSGATPLELFGTEFPNGALGRIGVMISAGQTSPTNAGKIDAIHLSSGANGYYDVVGFPKRPIILTQPASQVIDYGQPAAFTVSATGVGELAYQWRHSGTDIPAATGTTFSIASAQPLDRGHYDVVVSHRYGAGSVTSNTVSLLFRDEVVPLSVTSLQLIPSSTVHTGTAVSMIATGTGTDPITYQWLKNGTTISGATSGTYTIDPVSPADTAAYSVRLNDLAGVPVVSGTLSLSVLGPPIILTQPVSQTVMGSSSVSFSVSATCVSPMAYQWYLDSVEIPGATAATYGIPRAQMRDAGDYSVKVSDADYPQYYTFSSTAALTVIPVDTRQAAVIADFNDYPNVNTDIKLVENTGSGFSETKWGTQTGAIQTIAGDLVPPSATRYGIRQPVDAPNAPRSVYLNNTGAMMRTQERSLATPLSGVVWGSFLVNNSNAEHRSGVTFNLNQTAGTISDTSGPFMRWIHAKGTSLVIYSSGTNATATTAKDTVTIPGAFILGQPALVVFSYDTAAQKLNVWVDPALTDKAGDFASVRPAYTSGDTPFDLFGESRTLSRIGVVIGTINGTSPGNSPVFDSLRLSSGANGYYDVTGISVPPTILTQPAPKTAVSRGANATLTVSATGVGPLLYQWTFWGTAIPGANAASLAISNVQAGNVGEYQVIVTNDGGPGSVASDKAVLLVSEDVVPLAITQQPSLTPSTVVDGTPVSLSVTAVGTPPIKYQWRKNGVAIEGATGGAFELASARVEDSGDYDVVITDLALGKVTSAVVPLRVQIPPSIITQPQNATSYEGGPATFVVEALGTDITYQWKRNGTPVAGGTNATLALNNLTAADNGATYMVVVANSVGSVDSASAALTLKGSTKPPQSGSAVSTGDATIENGSNSTTNLNGSGLIVAASGTTDGARKSYLSFDLPLAVESEDAASASLALTLGNAPFIATGTAAMPPKNPVRLRLHGIVNSNDTWTENAITWDNAPAAANSQTAPGAGTVPLAEVTVDVASRNAGDTVTFADARIAQFLNWAAGRRGDLYGSGLASDADHRVTFVVTSIDEGPEFAGVRFADKETGGAAAPSLAFQVGAPSATTAAKLENDRYVVTLASDRGVDVKDKTTGATAHFSAAFEVVHNDADPEFAYAETGVSAMATSGTIRISLPTWKSSGTPAHDYGAADGTRVSLSPSHATVSDGRIMWRFAPGAVAIAGFHASLDLPAGAAAPRLRWTLSPAASRYHAVAFAGLPAVANDNVNTFYMPGIWNERRFPDKQYVIDEVRATTPAVLRQLSGETVVAGVAVDPFEIPNRVSATKADRFNTRHNSLFGLATNTPDSAKNVPTVIAPLYGSAGSLTDGTQSFSVRLMVRDGSLDDAVRDVVTNVYGFHDYRRNLAGGSLNTALDNLFDFLLDETVDPETGKPTGYSYWLENEKANSYQNDKPGYARFQSAATALSLAMVRDDPAYYEKRALPTIEYFISRDNQITKIDGYDPEYPMGGPVKAYGSADFFTLLALTGGRTSAFSVLADQAWTKSDGGSTPLLSLFGDNDVLTRDQTYRFAHQAWYSFVAGYRATGNDAYLKKARAIADNYIKFRYTDGPAATFGDVPGGFWNQIAGRWDLLLEMYELTGDAAYAENAMKAMDGFVRHLHFAPALNDLSVDGASAITPSVKSWMVSEVGLPSEASDTSSGHRAIFMGAYAAPSLMRVAGLTSDPFYAAVSRSTIVGRWLNYPGYTIRSRYKADVLGADYPLRWFSDYQGTSAHYNHPAMLAAFGIDFLMSDVEYKSAQAIRFPYQISDSRIYFRGRAFGAAAGEFYGESGVWPWMPRGLVTLAGENAAQLNYVAGRGNGRLYIAFMNQSANAVTATVSLRADKVQLAPGARMRVWIDNAFQGYGAFNNAVTTVTVSPGGITAIAIDDAAPALALQSDYEHGHGKALPAESFSQRADLQLGRVTGVVISVSPSRQSAYVYLEAGTDVITSATLKYSINGGAEQTVVKAAYPFEFSVPLPGDAQYFTYSVTGEPAGGGAAVGGLEDTLYLATPPLITRHPESISVNSGEPVLFSIDTDDPGGQYTYQWFKNDVPIPNARSSSYGFIATMADDGGEYYVVVTKGLIDVVSDPATLTVIPKPDVVITTQPAGEALPAGTPHTLGIVAENAEGYQWYKNGQPIPDATASTLALAGAEYESGSYHVVVHGMVGGVFGSLASDIVTMTFTPVAGAPRITVQPQGKAVTAGSAFTLSVTATGAASYQWYRDNIAILGATTSVLALPGAQSDDGIYHVVAANNVGSTVSARAVVTVMPNPVQITVQPVGGIVQHGSQHILSVTVSGEAEYQWRRDGVPIPGATSSTLVISGLPSDAGIYDVIVITPVGTITSGAVTVTITPNPDSRFAQSSAIAMDAAGVLYVADSARHVIQAVSNARNVSVFAGALDAAGSLDGAGLSARFNKPAGLVVRSGTLYVADAGNNAIRTVSIPGALVSTLVSGANSDASKRLSNPGAIAVDSAGNVYIADTGNNVIRKVDASGTLSTIAGAPGVSGTTDASGTLARFNAPSGLAIFETGNSGTLYIADTGNNTLRAISLGNGAVSTLAGRPAVAGCEDGAGAAALLNAPRGLVLDGPDLYFVDTGNSIIRRYAGGAVSTVAGYPGIGSLPGVPGFKDGNGTNAWFDHPEDITIAPDGTLYVADTGNRALRSIDVNDRVATLAITATTSGSTTPPPSSGGGGGGGGGGALSPWLLLALAALAGVRRLVIARGK